MLMRLYGCTLPSHVWSPSESGRAEITRWLTATAISEATKGPDEAVHCISSTWLGGDSEKRTD
ncbi:hypothetical protein EYF80_058526 [Liparis tanakae]|uniref:Uncharacterized protein n=1 Tax=Liparis tanakae TaxID=230148 RepID=A0A4Z2ERC7_9TELE|nr:hypothetical protein EYF80_058526 [Liparis tanakae]